MRVGSPLREQGDVGVKGQEIAGRETSDTNAYDDHIMVV